MRMSIHDTTNFPHRLRYLSLSPRKVVIDPATKRMDAIWIFYQIDRCPFTVPH